MQSRGRRFRTRVIGETDKGCCANSRAKHCRNERTALRLPFRLKSSRHIAFRLKSSRHLEFRLKSSQRFAFRLKSSSVEALNFVSPKICSPICRFGLLRGNISGETLRRLRKRADFRRTFPTREVFRRNEAVREDFRRNAGLALPFPAVTCSCARLRTRRCAGSAGRARFAGGRRTRRGCSAPRCRPRRRRARGRPRRAQTASRASR